MPEPVRWRVSGRIDSDRGFETRGGRILRVGGGRPGIGRFGAARIRPEVTTCRASQHEKTAKQIQQNAAIYFASHNFAV